MGLIAFALVGLLIKKRTKKRNHRNKKDYQNWNIELLNALEWKRFEEVIARYYELIGYRSEFT